ncbi:MAG TPA: hypothetical protein VEZ71_26795, partial [Archangium sp.]|nr:hypothetical protein [Archangium sp.]
MISGLRIASGLSDPHTHGPLAFIKLENPLGNDGAGSLVAAFKPIREGLAGHDSPTLEEVVAEAISPLLTLEPDREAPFP